MLYFYLYHLLLGAFVKAHQQDFVGVQALKVVQGVLLVGQGQRLFASQFQQAGQINGAFVHVQSSLQSFI